MRQSTVDNENITSACAYLLDTQPRCSCKTIARSSFLAIPPTQLYFTSPGLLQSANTVAADVPHHDRQDIISGPWLSVIFSWHSSTDRAFGSTVLNWMVLRLQTPASSISLEIQVIVDLPAALYTASAPRPFCCRLRIRKPVQTSEVFAKPGLHGTWQT
jgi:hypothetical protein